MWQKELNSGDLLLFEEVTIDPPWRRQGLGTRLVQAVIKQCRTESKVFFGITFATGLTAELHRQISEEDGWHEERIWTELFVEDVSSDLKIAAVRFWRSLGFRRVGLSKYFAFASDAQHPSHPIAMDQDLPSDSEDEFERWR